MCDGCPDITYLKDKDVTEKLVWSCRLEELMQYNNFLRMVPKKEEVALLYEDITDLEMEKT
jgi:hypothetical protein